MDIDPLIVIYALGLVVSSAGLLITYYRWVHLPRSEKKRKKRIKEMERLSKQKQVFEDCKFSTETVLKHIEGDDFSSFSFTNLDLDFKLLSKVESLTEGYRSLSDWLSASKNGISITLEAEAKQELASTLKDYNFVQLLQADKILHRFLYEEEVTKRWIEKTCPDFFHELVKNLKEPEKTLDAFFIKINEAFKEHRILKRFRKEKTNLVKLGKEIIKDCSEEINSLTSELSKYSDLKDELEDHLAIPE